MAFSFGFSGDDIDIDDSEIEQPVQGHSISAPAENDLPTPVEAKRHEMGEWVSLIFQSLNEYSLLTMIIDPNSPISNIIQQASARCSQS